MTKIKFITELVRSFSNPGFYLTIVSLVLISACTSSRSEKSEHETMLPLETDTTALAENHTGKTLMETNCYICHNPSAAEKEGRIGPPMIEIKAVYLKAGMSKSEFINSLWDFVKMPDSNKAKMTDAVARFGLMPYQPYPKTDIEKIGAYLYDYQIEEPNWFNEYWKRNYGDDPYYNSGKKLRTKTKLTKSEIGLKYATETKKLLGMNLMGAIQEEGVEHALQFCNEKALQLTDSMGDKFNASIKRVSDKPRNPVNQANEIELEKIAQFKSDLSNNKKIDPIISETGGKVNFYYPILTNDLCLKCHGNLKTQIAQPVQRTLSALYPEDKAFGYGVNEVRGIWSISFESEED